MKRVAIGGGIAVLLLIGVFVWLLSQSGPEHAPKDIQTIDLEDKYEK